MSTNLKRRQFLKTASLALVLMPIVTYSRQARANTNSKVRTDLKYQDVPKNDMNCTSCLEFIPGKTDQDFGMCKVIPGDNEISPNGYCTKWNTM
jgi:hypothetical protein